MKNAGETKETGAKVERRGEEALIGARFDTTRALLARLRAVTATTTAGAATAPDADAISRAIEWAIDAHLDQRDRPDGSPYIEHVARVGLRAAEWARTPETDLVVAGLLHDLVEDQFARFVAADAAPSVARTAALEAVRVEFGERVARTVAALTNPETEFELARARYAKASPPWDALLIAEYTRHFVTAVAGDPAVALIKFADFSDNALSLASVNGPSPRRYAWLRRKYRACMEFLIEWLPTLPAEHPLAFAREEHTAALRTAWRDHWAADADADGDASANAAG